MSGQASSWYAGLAASEPSGRSGRPECHASSPAHRAASELRYPHIAATDSRPRAAGRRLIVPIHGASMEPTELVTVFNYRHFETGSDMPLIAPYKATRETIIKNLKCELLEGTGEQVLSVALDEQGRYRRIATGWGELD